MDSVDQNQTNRDPRTCPHETFESAVKVNRLTDVGGGPITGYAADVSIRCAQCKHDFFFVGLPMGCTPDHPTVSADGKELRIPISPIKGIMKGVDRPQIRDELTFTIERAPRPGA
jgi:hypothetical protein